MVVLACLVSLVMNVDLMYLVRLSSLGVVP